MDVSWRTRIGMPTFPRRRSTEDTSSSKHLKHHVFSNPEILNPEDFDDVFGGPPRTVLAHKYSMDFTSTSSFYEEIFLSPEPVFDSSRSRRNLPTFGNPDGINRRGFKKSSEGFYSDIFGYDEDIRLRTRSQSSCMSKSKSHSSSVLSSEDWSPSLQTVAGEDSGLSSFASKLRPINVPSRWSSSTVKATPEIPISKQDFPSFPPDPPSMEKIFMEENNYNLCISNHYGHSKHVTSPEVVSPENNSYRTVKMTLDDFEILSACSSPESSVCQEQAEVSNVEGQDLEDEEDEIMSAYVIEINAEPRRGDGEAVCVDEAIAWAKERYYHAQSRESCVRESEQEQITEMAAISKSCDQGLMLPSEVKDAKNGPAEDAEQESEIDKYKREMDILDEDIRLWSSGKEANIRLLLATLHHILWPNSGWCAISVAHLKETSQVKKAYQKARLCLHPDKLQQRGATQPQKYIAESAFAILQDAWAAFISR